MKITALEIRQKEFQKGFRGFDKDEVEAFLLSLSQEWEKMVEENKALKIRLDNAEKEVSKLREVEDSLFKTLKTAETTGASVVEQANKSAELLIQEARMKAEQLLSDAQRKSDKVYTGMIGEISELEREFRNLENLRDDLITGIRNLSNDSLDKIERIDTGRKDFSHIKDFASKVVVENIEAPTAPKMEIPSFEKETTQVNEPVVESPVVEVKPEEKSTIKFDVPQENITEEKKEGDDEEKSFFDQVGE